jgi:hypothetical protein
MESGNEIERKLLKLAQVVLHQEADSIPSSLIKNLMKYLKFHPTNPSSHQTALRIRLRQQILANYSSPPSSQYDASNTSQSLNSHGGAGGGSNVVMVTKFENETEAMQKRNSKYLSSFLFIFQSLCFSNYRKSQQIFPSLAPSPEEKRNPSREVPAAPVVPGGRLPIGIPPPLNEEELTLLNDQTLWISPDTEALLLRDLLLIFQVPHSTLSLLNVGWSGNQWSSHQIR